MKTSPIVMAALVAVSASAANADIVGATAGAYYWKQSWDGSVQSGSDSINTQDDLGYDDDTGNSIFVAIEHPIPLLPNIRLQRTELEISESNDLSRSFTFDGDTYTAADTVSSTTDLTHTDATLYYEVLDNWVNLDVGFTVRVFDGEVSLATTGRSGQIDLDAPLPMAYASARFELPFSGLYASATGNLIAYDSNSVSDMTAGIGYEIGVVALELNYRNFDVELEDDDEKANVTVDGIYLGVVIDI